VDAGAWAQVTQRVSLDSAGVQGNESSFMAQEVEAAFSADGRYVVFWSSASNLVPGDTNGAFDVFLRDRETGATEIVSVDSAGVQGLENSLDPSISADGRYVAFESHASNLVPGDTNGSFDVFVRDRLTGTTERLSVDSSGAEGNNQSFDPSISADGRFVAFYSSATNLVPGDTNDSLDVFVHDRQSGTTERVSVDWDGAEGNGHSRLPSISSDGRYVAFESSATNLVAGDTNGVLDIFVRDRQNGTTERVSVGAGGAQGDGASSLASISGDGRYVTFESFATNLVPGDTHGFLDVFFRDRLSATTTRVSVDSGGAQGNGDSGTASVSADGRFVAFHSFAANLAHGDTNGFFDVFVHDRQGSPAFKSQCDPGVGDVIACPCANAPSGPGRGCDNSAATGGASLSASGGTFLSSDSLVFTTSGEKPTALSIVMQGNASVAGGVVCGQGVRCVGGTIIRRLFIKSATAGGISVPDFGAGDPTVSARSAAKGDLIQAGTSRWYLVYYRDPVVLGLCSPLSTFTTTQTGEVAWSL
jgi:Tol biopolymer transport system component